MQVKHIYAGAAIEPSSAAWHSYRMSSKRQRRRTFLREWRKMKPGRTLEQVAAELEMSQPQLGRIERGDQPYNQDLLEALADLYGCEVPDLLMRDPTDPEGMWTLWEKAKPGQRIQIVELGKALMRVSGEEEQQRQVGERG